MKRFGGWLGVSMILLVALTLVLGNFTLAVMLAVVLLPHAVWQVRAQRAAKIRAAADLVSDGKWRVRVYDGRHEVMGRGTRWISWVWSPYTPADLTAAPQGLVFTPTPGAQRVGYETRVVPWDQVVSIARHDLGRKTADGQLSFTSQTEFTVMLTGDFVPWLLRPDWKQSIEREMAGGRKLDAETLAEAEKYAVEMQKDALGERGRMGTLPVKVTSDAADGLFEAVRSRAVGDPLS